MPFPAPAALPLQPPSSPPPPLPLFYRMLAHALPSTRRAPTAARPPPPPLPPFHPQRPDREVLRRFGDRPETGTEGAPRNRKPGCGGRPFIAAGLLSTTQHHCWGGGGVRHTMPHPAQSQHANYWAPRTRKRHQQEHRPQRPTESSDPTQHAKGRPGDRPGPRKGATTRRNVTQGGVLPPLDTPPDFSRSDPIFFRAFKSFLWRLRRRLV